MEFEVPKRHILRPTLSTNMVQQVLRWERQKGWSSRRKARGPWQTNVVILMIFFGKEKTNTREWSNLIYFFQHFPFWIFIYSKIGHSHFGAWSFLLVHIEFTPSEGPKDFIN